MQRTGRGLTKEEKVEIFEQIIEIVIRGSTGPVRSGCKSRAGMIGYDIQMLLLNTKILRPGRSDDQERLDL